MFKMHDTSLCNFSTSSRAFSTGAGLKWRYLCALVSAYSLFFPSSAFQCDKTEILNIVQILHHNDTTTGRTRDCKVSDGCGNSRTRSLEPKTRLIGKVWIFIHILVCILLTSNLHLDWPPRTCSWGKNFYLDHFLLTYMLYMNYMSTLKKTPTNIDAFSVKKYGLDFWDQFGMAKNHGVLGMAKKKKFSLKPFYIFLFYSWYVGPKPKKPPVGVY